MDTDWCIVCDTKISTDMGYLSDVAPVNKTNQTTMESRHSFGMQTSSSAFCSTSCFIKACDEAQSKNMSAIRQPSTNIQKKTPNHSHSNNNPLYVKPFQVSSRKDPSKVFFDSHNSPTSNSKSNQSNIISPFTFGSYGSCSTASSNVSSIRAPRS